MCERLPLAVFTAFAVLTPTARAHADDVRDVAGFGVARDSSGQRVATLVDSSLRKKLAQRRALRLVDPERRLSTSERSREEEVFDRAHAALADGRRAYDALDLDTAIARLAQAVDLYQKSGPLIGDLAEFRGALTHLGASLVLRGSSDEGEAVFDDLLTVDPGHTLEGFPASVMRAFSRAVERRDLAPRGAIEIYSSPPDAAVFIDGRFEGVTPLVVSDLPSGTHYLRLEKFAHRAHGAPFEIVAGQRITSQTRLRDFDRAVEIRDLALRGVDSAGQPTMAEPLRALARILALDRMIFVATAQSKKSATLVGSVFDAARGASMATERIVLNVDASSFSSDIDAFSDRLIAACESIDAESDGASARSTTTNSGQAAPTNEPSNTSNMPEPAPDTGMPRDVILGWTLVGVGGAALITGTIFASLALVAHDDFRNTSQASPDLHAIQSTGKTDAWVADGCFLGGGLATVGGAILLVLAKTRSPTTRELFDNARPIVFPTEGGAMLGLGGDF